jgi:hypothetical protein
MYSFAVRSPIRLANRGGCEISVRGASCEVITYQMSMPGTFRSQYGGRVALNESCDSACDDGVHIQGTPRPMTNLEERVTLGKALWVFRMGANSFRSAPMPGGTRPTAQINSWRSAFTRTTRKPAMRRHYSVRLDAPLFDRVQDLQYSRSLHRSDGSQH